MFSNNPLLIGPGTLAKEVVERPIESLHVSPKHARTHSKRQIRQIADSIREFGNLAPILIDEDMEVIYGAGRLEAQKLLKRTTVLTLAVTGLSDTQKRAFRIVDNKVPANAGWNTGKLALELQELLVELPAIGLDLTITGFSLGEIDQILEDQAASATDPNDDIPPLEKIAVTQPGDLWQLGEHRICCGDARDKTALDRLMDGVQARMAICDVPYNVKIRGHVQGRGRIKHREFAFASGEMTERQFVAFLKASFANMVRGCVDGAIAFIFIDWRHVADLLKAAKPVFTEYKNLVVWNKTSPGQGSFYRSQFELIGVFKIGTAPHINTFGLGENGRTRSNVWTYPGANSFHAGRMEELASHPTVKPVALVADALRDCSMKGDVVLDTFLGSGTTIMAAEKVGRRGYGMEIDPLYVDVAVRRWQAHTRADAVLAGDGRTFEEVEAERIKAASPALDSGPAKA